MNKIIIYTPAYNAEKTLRRAVESVLNQTHKDFIYYLLDNAATDDTYEIIKEYAKRDKRIVPLHNEKNWVGNGISDVVKGHESDCYICELDADDEYAPDFLEKMLVFIKKNDLDIAACGSNFIDMKTNKYIGDRKIKQKLVIDGDGFDKYFPVYHQFMRTIWGKVYAISVLHKPEYKNHIHASYGNDTIFAMNAFHNANRIGILTESLHKYYVSPQSVSYKLYEKRIESDRILFDATYDFLISKIGVVSDENMDFLQLVYLNAIKDTLNVLINSKVSIYEKLEYLLDIFQSHHTQELIKWPGAKPQKSQLFSQVALWVLSKNEARCGSGLDIVVDIFVAMDIYPTKVNGWKDGEVFILLTKIRDRQIEKGLSSNADSHIISVIGNSPYLIGLNIGFLCYFCNITFSILQSDEENALNQIIELIVEEMEIPDEYIESLLILALNLSAKLELHDYFIYFKKLQISLLIDLSRINEAIEEFADWDKILSDDMDFKSLKERLDI